MAEKGKDQNLEEATTLTTKREELVEMVEDLLTPEEKQELGETPADKVVESMGYLAVFVPAPATFDKEAFLFTGGSDLQEKEAEIVWSFLKRTGIIKSEEGIGRGRVSVSEKIVTMLANPSNGFLTEEL